MGTAITTMKGVATPIGHEAAILALDLPGFCVKRSRSLHPSGSNRIKLIMKITSMLIFAVILGAIPGRVSSLLASSDKGEESLTPNARIAMVAAQKEIELKNDRKAEKILLDFIKKYPGENHHFVEFTVAQILYNRNSPSQALEHYKNAVRLSPEYKPAWQNLAKICFDQKKFNEAAHAMEMAYAAGKERDYTLLFHATVAYISAKKPEKALPHIEFLSSGRAGTPEINWVKILATLSMELKCPERALKPIERLLQGKNPDPLLWRLAATLHLERKNYRDAAKALSIYAMLLPLSIEEELLLADLYSKLDIPIKASKLYEQVINKRPDEKLYIRLVSSLMQAGRSDEGCITAERGLLKYPRCHELWKMKGWLCYERNEFKKASTAFSKACEIKQNDNESRFMLGICANKSGQMEVAKKALKAVISCPEYKAHARALIKKLESVSENT